MYRWKKRVGVVLAAFRFRCMDCELLACFICGDQPRYAFSTSAVSHVQTKKGREVRCIDCSHPECSNPKCRTCRICRALTCRGGAACAGVIRPLQAKQQPTSMAEKLQYRCERCLYPRCRKCQKEMPKGGCRQRFLKSGKEQWTCGECQTVEENKNVLAKRR